MTADPDSAVHFRGSAKSLYIGKRSFLFLSDSPLLHQRSVFTDQFLLAIRKHSMLSVTSILTPTFASHAEWSASIEYISNKHSDASLRFCLCGIRSRFMDVTKFIVRTAPPGCAIFRCKIISDICLPGLFFQRSGSSR